MADDAMAVAFSDHIPIDAADKYGFSPLMQAAQKGFLEYVALFSSCFLLFAVVGLHNFYFLVVERIQHRTRNLFAEIYIF